MPFDSVNELLSVSQENNFCGVNNLKDEEMSKFR